MSGDAAVYEEDGGRATVQFTRGLPHPRAAVWPALTEPDRLAHWFPCRVEADLRPGGALRFTFADDALPESSGEITELAEGERLTFTWGKEILRFELEAEDEGTLLHFTHLLSRPDHAARDARGLARLPGPAGRAPRRPGNRGAGDGAHP
jgi:uncharacterized protein YndB with AHSA1/START domain